MTRGTAWFASGAILVILFLGWAGFTIYGQEVRENEFAETCTNEGYFLAWDDYLNCIDADRTIIRQHRKD